jgi:hypothetical protein
MYTSLLRAQQTPGLPIQRFAFASTVAISAVRCGQMDEHGVHEGEEEGEEVQGTEKLARSGTPFQRPSTLSTLSLPGALLANSKYDACM